MELHEIEGEDVVKFYYNPQPDLGAESYEGLQSLVLPLGSEDRIWPLKDCEVGAVALCLGS